MRIDMPQASVISDPASQQAILLDHVKKEASILPIAQQIPGAPGAPQIPGGSTPAAPAAALQVENLGKSMIEGHEVEGQRFTLPPTPQPPKPPMPQLPKPPSPKMPGLPKVPGLPKMPGAPAAPAPPSMPPKPNITEVWTSVKLKTPVLTKITTSAGEITTYSKPTSTAEPPASLFQVPQGYKIKSKP